MSASLLADLQEQRTICERILQMAQHEHAALGSQQDYQPSSGDAHRKNLLDRLTDSLNSIRKQRVSRQALGGVSLARDAHLDTLLKANLDLIMKIIVLERESEQLLVRRGLLPPGRLPGRQPHFVSDIYRRAACG